LVRYDPQSPWGEQQSSGSQDTPVVNPEMFQGTREISALTENSHGVIYFGASTNSLYSYMGWELSQNIETHFMHVASIEMNLHGNSEIMGAGVQIMVVDNNGNPVQGARVVGNWSGISVGNDFDDYTNDNGLAGIGCPRITHNNKGKFCFEVTNITRYKDYIHSEWIYNPEANIMNSGCINTSARIVGVTTSDCKNVDSIGAGTVENADEICTEYIQGRLYISHLNANYNCCLDSVEVSMGLDDNLIVLHEYEVGETPCDCDCPVDVTTRIEGLETGIYTIKVYQDGAQIGEIQNFTI